MIPFTARSLCVLASAAAVASAHGGHDSGHGTGHDFGSGFGSFPDVLFKDVVVVGGGASGAYAAVRLRDDYNMSVALIEKQAILGGHVDTYDDPNTGTPYNYGVQSFVDIGNARTFFEKMGIPTGALARATTTTRYVDFKTGQELEFELPSTADQMADLDKYRQLCEQWEDLMQPGYFNFPEPDKIPGDLLLPFGEFITKHNISNAMPFIYKITGLGSGDITSELTLWVMQAFGASMARSILGLQDSWTPASGRNQDLYDAIDNHLGDDVFVNSTVVASWRTDWGVFLTVKNSETHKLTLITAKRLILAIPPTETNLAPFNLDKNEESIFSQFEYYRIYAGIVSNDALPVNYTIFNLPESAQPDNYLEYPAPTFTARFDYIGENKYFRIMLIGKPDVDTGKAKKFIQADVDRLIHSGVLEEPSSSSSKLEWVALEDHGPVAAHVSAKALKAGFIQDLYSLQGQRATWYTGAAWSAAFQTNLWAFDDVLLPKIVEDLKSDKDFSKADFTTPKPATKF